MLLRTAVGAAVLTAALSFPLAGVAAAQDLDCDDFTSQAAAQDVYNRNPADPNALDLDKDGRACETRPGGAVGSGEGAVDLDGGATPTRGVETGAGGTADERRDPPATPGVPAGVVLAAGGAALVAGGVVLVRRRAVRRSG